MSEKKFQIGDRVRFNECAEPTLRTQEDTVMRLDRDGAPILGRDPHYDNCGWNANWLDLVRAAPTPADQADTPDAEPKPLTAGQVRSIVIDFYNSDVGPGLLSFVEAFNELDNARVVRFAELMRAGVRA